MKKFLAILTLLAIVATATTSCTFAGKYRLKNDIEEANKNCPMEAEDLGTLTSIRYDESSDMVVFNYVVSADSKDIITLFQSDPALTKTMMRVNFSADNTDVQNLLKEIVDAGCGIRAVYTHGHQDVSVELSCAECRELLNNPPSEQEKNRLSLLLVVSSMNGMCPIDMGDDMIMESIYDTGSDMVYSIKVPDDMLVALNQGRDDLVAGLRNGLASENMKQIVKTCIVNNRGIVYRYAGSISGERYEIRFPVEDLRSL